MTSHLKVRSRIERTGPPYSICRSCRTSFSLVTWLGGYYFLALVWILCLLAQREMLALIKLQGFRPNAPVSYAAGTVVIASALFPALSTPFFVLALLAIITADTLNRYEPTTFQSDGNPVRYFLPAATMLSLIYIRNIDSDPLIGFGFLLMMFFMVWGNDTFAYFTGKTAGRHLMAPHLSPKKTWEGFTRDSWELLSGYGLRYWSGVLPGYSMAELALLPILISTVGPVGDLTISKNQTSFRRQGYVNSFCPAIGGILDRFDSILLVAPVVVYLHPAFSLGTLTSFRMFALCGNTPRCCLPLLPTPIYRIFYGIVCTQVSPSESASSSHHLPYPDGRGI